MQNSLWNPSQNSDNNKKDYKSHEKILHFYVYTFLQVKFLSTKRNGQKQIFCPSSGQCYDKLSTVSKLCSFEWERS